MIRKGIGLWGLAMVLQSATASAQPPRERDWSAALREDARALHDDIAANHPGPVNAADPGFAMRNDAQLARALERARDARSYADYFFALREYVSSFDDGHMGFGAFGNTPNDYRWPGFATAYDGRGEIRVTHRLDDAPVPLGARLVGCDGLTAAQYAAATLGRMWGRWLLESQHQTWGSMLFLDEGSRYIPQARRCTFDVDGAPREVTLAWRPIATREAFAKMDRRKEPRRFEARTLADGTRWYAIPSFNAEAESPAAKALPGMIAGMRAERAALARASAVVLDLRGNGGGSSDWSVQIARVLWGRSAIDRLPSSEVSVDWRVSKANLEAIEQSYASQKAGAGFSPDSRRWFETVIHGLTAALARGNRLWRHEDDDQDAPPPAPREKRPPPLAGPVYVITDASCGSACLDAVDLWRDLGAIHVGRTTSADTLYMEVRQLRLPSGITAVSMPMKVYRGRARGSNEPAVPVHAFTGDINDTAALELWLASLPPTRRR
jgi:hypothetical protein